MSPSSSIASGMTAPTFWFAAVFSATLRVAVVPEKTGALLPGVCEPSTLWPDCCARPLGHASGTSALVPVNWIESPESSLTGPSGLFRSVPSYRKMPLSSMSVDSTV